MIYIVCPNYKISGGPEALHQLSYYLTIQNIDNRIAYIGKKTKNPVPKTYLKYKSKYVWLDKLNDLNENHIIFPETFVNMMRFFPKSKKSIWWLGVGAYKPNGDTISLKNRFLKVLSGIKNIDKIKIILALSKDKKHNLGLKLNNFVGSYYAEDFLIKNECQNVIKLIEPIGLDFITEFDNVKLSAAKRNNEILYNPNRDIEIVPKLAKAYPDLIFLPIQNMNHKEIVKLLKKSKLYVDFGDFPGPERLPKETVSMGCCVITSNRGAANFHGDVPIPKKYKFDKKDDFALMYKRIKECLDSYDTVINDFEEYRTHVYNLEKKFKHQIVENFC